jgi:hypothetical protein
MLFFVGNLSFDFYISENPSQAKSSNEEILKKRKDG